MAEIIIDNVKYTNVPNKKAGTKFASTLTQSNIGMSQAVQDYVNSSYFYTLVNAIDINWDGIDIGENSYINTTSDLIKWIESKAGDIDLSSYATITYVNDKITELIGGAPETLDTLKELADALEDEASLAYVTQALDGKADKSSLTNYATTSYVTTELDKKADKSQLPDMTNYVSYTTANSYYMTVNGPKQIINSVKTFVGNKLINFRQSTSSDKLGFTLYNNNEKDVGGLEYRPDTINGKPLISLQHYVGTANLSMIDQSYLGFRQTQGNNKYHLLAPIPADVATIETITSTNYKNFFMPLVFQNGSNKVYADCAGLVDMASLMPDLNDYATNSYVTTELDKKADLDDIPSAPDLTPYLTYADANSYYATVAYVTNELASKADIIDLSTYATTAQLDNRTMIGNGGTITTFGQHALNDITEFDLKVHFIRDETLQIYIHANNSDSNSVTVNLYSGSGSQTETDEYFEVSATYDGSDGDYEIWHFTCNEPINSISFTNYDGDGIEFEMSYGSSITVIENFTYYVSYTQANSYYVDINSYNALAARVEELASWIVAYHTPGPGPEPSKPYATAQWLDSSAGVVTIGIKTVVAGDSTTYTFTFDGNPATGWTFTNIGAVQMMNTTTGDITIDVSNYTTSNIEYVNCEAYYPEDSSYQYCRTSFTVTILPAGMNPQFYYDPISCNISNTDSQYTPMIYDSIGEQHTIEYHSSKPNVATVSSDGTISYVSDGNCTITATAIDGSNNVLATATIDVTCYVSKMDPSGGWEDNGTMVSEVVVNYGSSKTLSWNGYPESGWSYDNYGQPGISVNQNTGELTISGSTPEGKYHVSASYTEDSVFSGYYTEISIRVIGHDDDTNFYFTNYSTSLDDSMTISAPEYVKTTYMLNNGDITWYSSDNSVAIVTQGAVPNECIITYQGAGSCYIKAAYSGMSGDASAKLYVTCTSSAPVFTNVNMYYKVGKNYDQTISKGYFDTDPIENGVDYNGSYLRIFVEFEGPQYTYNSGDFTITKDSTYDSGEYIQIGTLNYESGSYNNGINSLEFSIDWWAAGSEPGTNRFIFDFSYNGVSLISDGIKIYNNGEVC